MKKYKGDVDITSYNFTEWNELLKGVTHIIGNLFVSDNATLSALTVVDGYLHINSNATLSALTSVGDDLYVSDNASLIAEALTSVGDDLYVSDNASLIAEALTSVDGNLFVSDNATLSSLTSVSGYLHISDNATLENQLYPYCKKNKWHITELSSDFIISKNLKNAIYWLNDSSFEREWFLKIKNDQLTPEQVFAIDNVEHRRIAYQYMDKLKMKSLKDYKVLDEKNDNNGNPMRIVSFTIQNMKEPLMFYNCYCPSTRREYFLGTNKKTCDEAKSSMFGINNIEFVKEW